MMNKHVDRLINDLEEYLSETDLLSVESLTDSVLKTLYLANTYRALFERENEED